MTINVKPTGYFVLVELPEVEKKTASGIILAQETVDANDRLNESGTVVDIGPIAFKGFADGEPWVKVGDKILYPQYSGRIVTDPLTAKKYRLINDNDCLCIVTGDVETQDD